MLDFDNVEPIKEEELEINTVLQKVYVQPALKQEAKTEAPKKEKKEKKEFAFPSNVISTVIIVLAIITMGMYIKGDINDTTTANANIIALGINNLEGTVTGGFDALTGLTNKVLSGQTDQNTAIADLSDKVGKIKIPIAAKPQVNKFKPANLENYKKCIESVQTLFKEAKYTGDTYTMALTQCKGWLK